MNEHEPSATVIALPQRELGAEPAPDDDAPRTLAPVIELAAHRRSPDTGPIPDLAA